MQKQPRSIIVDTTTCHRVSKVDFVKGIRGYTGVGLKEAKDLAESGDRNLLLTKRSEETSTVYCSVQDALSLIKGAGVTILPSKSIELIKNMELAVQTAVELGNYELAEDLIILLKKWG